MKKLLTLLLLLAAGAPALGQTIQQSGSVTAGHATQWVTSGVVKDAGTAASGSLTSLGVTASGSGLCQNSALTTAAGYQQICLGATTAGGGYLSVQNFGTAVAKDFTFNINGTAVTIPTGGGAIPSITLPLVSGDYVCASGTAGLLADCGWQQAVGSANQIPYWSSATALTNISAAASSVLITSSGSVPSLSQTLPSAVQGNITTVGTITSGTWAGTPITVVGGGTGAATLAAHGALIGEGTSAITSVTTSAIGQCLLSQGASSDPIWASCASGTGTAGGSDTQVQFNNATNLAGSANLTWASPALTIGQNATTTGQLVLANGGALGVSVTVKNPSATSAYNFNLPTGAGTSGQPLLSGGGGSTAMTFGTLQVAAGGTACSAAAGTCLDNITNFSSTGYINRTGSGTYAFSSSIPLNSGGTNANLTASNGGIFYSTASAGAILSGTATANQALLSGSSTTPAWSTATYPATTTINQVLYSSSANVITGLATANSGVLITSGSGVPSISSVLPGTVQANITTVGTIGAGVWNGTTIALANGGTSAALTANTGGVVYSGASAMAILSGTATASLPLLSGATAAPTWATISYPTSATSGGIPYFSSATAISSSAALTANQIVIGGGAGTTPSTFACATTTTVVHGGTPPTCSQIVAGDITTNTVSNTNLAPMATVTLKGNPTSGTANATDFTINGLTARGAPDATNDRMLIWDSAAGTLKYVTPAQVASSATAGVSSINGNTGAFTTSNGITNSTNNLISEQLVNAQTGTTYAIVNGDRAKLVTGTNAAAQAYSIAQAGAASAFLTGWFATVSNISTNANGIITITPTTSTINGAATLKLYQGQSVTIISDGTNYQIANLTSPTTGVAAVNILSNTLGSDVALNNTGSYFDGPSVAQGTSGTWFASGNVVLLDTVANTANFTCKLWDGTTIIESALDKQVLASTYTQSVTLSGAIASPAGNIRISCQDSTATTGFIKFNASGLSADSKITVFRIQ